MKQLSGCNVLKPQTMNLTDFVPPIISRFKAKYPKTMLRHDRTRMETKHDITHGAELKDE